MSALLRLEGGLRLVADDAKARLPSGDAARAAGQNGARARFLLDG